jgi:hypothetical protein
MAERKSIEAPDVLGSVWRKLPERLSARFCVLQPEETKAEGRSVVLMAVLWVIAGFRGHVRGISHGEQ